MPSKQRLKFVNYTTKDGLTDDVALKIVHDKRGFIWIATYNGLSRFDGYNYKNYTFVPGDTNSLRSIWVTDLLVDRKGLLWVSTEWGICWYDEVADNFHYINPINTLQILYKAPMCLGQNDDIWFATESGLALINTSTKKIQTTPLNRIADPTCIYFDGKQVWIGTRGHGLFTYNITTKKHARINRSVLDEQVHVMNFYKDREVLWAASEIGLLKINNSNNIEVYTKGQDPVKDKQANGMMCVTDFWPITGDSMLLCGTYTNGLLLFNKITKRFVYRWYNNDRSFENVPYGIFYTMYAANNILWIGTDHGLSKLNMLQQDYVTTLIPEITGKPGVNYLIKRIVNHSDNSSWQWLVTSSPTGHILLYDRVENKVLKEYHATDELGYNDIVVKDHYIWGFKQNGIDKYDATQGLLKTYNTNFKPFSTIHLSNNMIWIGTDRGIASFDTKTEKIKQYPMSYDGTAIENNSFEESFPVMGLAFDGKQTLWLACIKYGIFSFDIPSGIFKEHRQPSKQLYDTRNRCSSVEMGEHGNLWVGTMAGLTKFNYTENSFTNYNSSHGLISTYVYSIKRDSHLKIWGRGNAGVFSFNIPSQKFDNHALVPKLNAKFYSQCLSVGNNEMNMGFENGYVSFNTYSSIQYSTCDKVVLNACRLFNKRLDIDRDSAVRHPLQFDYNENMLSFDFTCIDFNQPNKLNYAFKLQGFNKDWVECGRRQTASYTNLPPGEYMFTVKARIADQQWGYAVRLLRFTIKPAFWQHIWFWPLVATVFILAVIAVAYKRVKKIRGQEEEKRNTAAMMEELETKAFRSQMNPHFIFNSLNSVQKYIWDNKPQDASEYLTKFSNLVRLILDHSMQKLITLEEELDALNLYLELEHRRCNNKFDYSIDVANNIDSSLVLLPPMLMQPYIENAIWHGLQQKEGRGILIVDIQLQKENVLICTIQDNGIGRRKAEELRTGSGRKSLSYGMHITQQRLNMTVAGGKFGHVTVEDLYDQNEEAAGTKIILEIPIETFEKIA